MSAWKLVLAYSLFSIVNGGCGAGADAPETENQPPASGDELSINPPVIFTGYDGVNTYKAPVIAEGGKSVTWSISDESLAALTPGADGELMITAKKAGEGVITLTAGGKSVTADLRIAAYTPEENAVGKQRYTNSQEGDPPCQSCHATGPDHSPTQTDADTDEQVMASFLTGVDPEGVPIPTPRHTWNVTEPQKRGLVAYLRSLEPRGYPEPDQPTPGN
jgi:hypothetical protein